MTLEISIGEMNLAHATLHVFQSKYHLRIQTAKMIKNKSRFCGFYF